MTDAVRTCLLSVLAALVVCVVVVGSGMRLNRRFLMSASCADAVAYVRLLLLRAITGEDPAAGSPEACLALLKQPPGLVHPAKFLRVLSSHSLVPCLSIAARSC